MGTLYSDDLGGLVWGMDGWDFWHCIDGKAFSMAFYTGWLGIEIMSVGLDDTHRYGE